MEAAQKINGVNASPGVLGGGTHAPINPNREIGRVKFYNEAKGFGFIECARHPGVDIFFKGNEIISPGGQVHGDDEVTFELMHGNEDNDKKLWANNVARTGVGSGFGGPPPSAPASRGLVPTVPGAPPASGTVKWYNEPKGFGFINPDGWKGDLYFKGSDVVFGAPLKTGDFCTFDYMKATVPEAKSWAINVKLVPLPAGAGGYPPPPSPYYPPSPYPLPDPYSPYPGPGYHPRDYPPPHHPYNDPYGPPAPYPTNPNVGLPVATQMGTVKWYNEKNAFGFILANGASGDIYFKGVDVVGPDKLTTGDPVSYDLMIGKDSEAKMWAINVRRYDREPESGPAAYDPRRGAPPTPPSGFGGKRRAAPDDFGPAKRHGQHPAFAAQEAAYGRTYPLRR
jgi:cold shock CspA family protein